MILDDIANMIPDAFSMVGHFFSYLFYSLFYNFMLVIDAIWSLFATSFNAVFGICSSVVDLISIGFSWTTLVHFEIFNFLLTTLIFLFFILFVYRIFILLRNLVLGWFS